MPVYQYDGVHYDLPDGLSNEQAVAKIKSHLGTQAPKPNLVDQAIDPVASAATKAIHPDVSIGSMSDLWQGTKGVGAALGDVLGGAVKGISGSALALGGAASGDNWDTARQGAGAAMEQTFPSLGASTGLDKTPAYQGVMYPFEKIGQGIEALGNAYDKATGLDQKGGSSAKVALDIGSMVLPIHKLGSVFDAAGKVIKKEPKKYNKNVEPPVSEMDAKLDALDQPAAEVKPPVVDTPVKLTEAQQLAETQRAYEQQLAQRVRGDELQKESAFYQPTPMENMAKQLTPEEAPVVQPPKVSPWDDVVSGLNDAGASERTSLPSSVRGDQRILGDTMSKARNIEAERIAAEQAAAEQARTQQGNGAIDQVAQQVAEQPIDTQGGVPQPNPWEHTVSSLGDKAAAERTSMSPEQLTVQRLVDESKNTDPGMAAQASREQAISNHPSVNASNVRVESLTKQVAALTDQVKAGEPVAPKLIAAQKALEKAQNTHATARKNVGEAWDKNAPKQSNPFGSDTVNMNSGLSPEFLNAMRRKGQGGAVNPDVLREGFRVITRNVSKLTDILAKSPQWQQRIRETLKGDYLKNQDGSPMVLLHGTTRNIEGKLKGSEQGFHAGNGGDASMFVQNVSQRTGTRERVRSSDQRLNGQIHPVAIKDGNYPLLKTDAGDWTPGQIIRGAKQGRRPAMEVWGTIKKALMDKGYSEHDVNNFGRYVDNQGWGKPQNQAFSDILKRAGIDGFFYENVAESPKRTMSDAAMASPENKAKTLAFLDEHVNNPKSFVTWNDNNFASIYDHKPTNEGLFNADKNGVVNMNMGLPPAIKEGLTKLDDMIRAGHNYRFNHTDAKTEFLSKLVPEAKGADGKFATPDTPEVALQKILAPGVVDIPAQNGIAKVTQSGMDMMAAKFRENPTMIAVSRYLNHAVAMTQYQVSKMVVPLEKYLSTMSHDELITHQKILQREMFNEKRYTDQQLQSLGLTEKQLDAYRMQRQAYDTALEIQNAARKRLGMEKISHGEAYMASSWNGDWHMPITRDAIGKDGKPIINGDGTTKQVLVWYVRTRSKAEGVKALEYLRQKHGNELNLKDAQPIYRGDSLNPNAPRDITGAYHDMLGFFKDDPIMSTAIEDSLKNFLEAKGMSIAGQNKHFLTKGNIRGALGDRPWLDSRENAVQGATAQMDYLKNSLRWANHQEAIANAKEILGNKDVIAKQENAVNFANSVLQHENGMNPKLLGMIENSIAKAVKGSRGGIYNFTGGVKTTMYLQTLGLNPMYMLATPLQYAVTGPMWHAVLSAQGFKTGLLGGFKTVGLAFTDATAGVMSHMAHELGAKNLQVPTMSKLGTRALQYAEDAGIVSRNLFDESGKVGASASMNAVSSGLGWTIGFPEKVARMNAFMGFVHHLEASGKYAGKELEMFRHAEEYTNRAMTSFMSHDRPQYVNNLGVVGQIGHVYKSYLFNQFHTMNAASRMAARGNPLPLASFIAGYALISGITNIPTVNEMDGMVNLFKDTVAKHFPQHYSRKLGDFDLKQSIISTMPETAGIRDFMREGAATRMTGAAVGSHLSANMVDIEHPLNNIPGSVLGQEMKEWSSLGGAIVHHNKAGVLQAIHANAPPLIKGQLESNNDRFHGPDTPNGRVQYKPDELTNPQTQDYRRTNRDTWFRQRGMVSKEEAVSKDNAFRANQDQMRYTTALDGLKGKIAGAILDHNNDGMKEYATAYLKINPEADLNQLAEQIGMKINTTRFEQQKIAANTLMTLQYIKHRNSMR